MDSTLYTAVLQFYNTAVLLYCSACVLLYCSFTLLLYCCTAVLHVYCCTAVLQCLCTAVLLYCSIRGSHTFYPAPSVQGSQLYFDLTKLSSLGLASGLTGQQA